MISALITAINVIDEPSEKVPFLNNSGLPT